MFRKLRSLGCGTKKLTLSVALIIIFVIWLDSLSISIFTTSKVGYKLNYTADKQRIGVTGLKKSETKENRWDSEQLALTSLVNLTTERAKTARLPTKYGTPTACYSKEMLNSPAINKLGKYPQDERYLTIGISSVTRPSGEVYLIETVKGLLDNFQEEEMKHIHLVIFLADFEEAKKTTLLSRLSYEFQKYVDQGFLHVIFAPQNYYPPLTNMKTKFGDSQKRIFWRSKLVVDFSFIMCYCRYLSKYYLHLEDDVIPTPSLYPKVRDFIASQKKPWPMLDASYMGHVAKVYHNVDLENIATFFFLLYDEMPVDWLIVRWRQIKYHDSFILPPASLFEHIGNSSSFVENKFSYKSKEKYFDLYDIKYRGLNPPATIDTSMKAEEGTKPEHAYTKGIGFFRASGVKKYDYVTITFTPPVGVRQVFVDTGALEAIDDRLMSGVLQASYLISDESPEKWTEFKTVGDFELGKVKVLLNSDRKVTCLKIVVSATQDKWLFLREIDVWRA
ncbi:alpha-1,3-mannosyl-glycoprotein 4-beta-N-acetylglucosaminyltransferase C-like isoform X1 [Acropora millepora]|uniref:alpha-1,3-mannosyl-glycoprotein 4-beta-N-acetylglucosaminyltransferase C-like isoform X1 n=1 Tax=Acropora millepora TaxID=45264 RepID=UPI001CF4E6A9|nr:alpha-1,3-mannosyl-glycoprotein 4-beta-N-acetylglucosaminyltransferase C-like isoform X1 [Acropora millepora]